MAALEVEGGGDAVEVDAGCGGGAEAVGFEFGLFGGSGGYVLDEGGCEGDFCFGSDGGVGYESHAGGAIAEGAALGFGVFGYG